MKTAFVDTQYFAAFFQGSDQWHERAVELGSQIGGYKFVTTDAILTEVLNYFSAYGEVTRREIAALVKDVLADENFQVVEQTREVFINANSTNRAPTKVTA
ncbi:MAG: nucleic acid-binding protein [Pyrinomonadaceae bacterium]